LNFKAYVKGGAASRANEVPSQLTVHIAFSKDAVKAVFIAAVWADAKFGFELNDFDFGFGL